MELRSKGTQNQADQLEDFCNEWFTRWEETKADPGWWQYVDHFEGGPDGICMSPTAELEGTVLRH